MGILGFGLAAVFLLLIPFLFLDRRSARGEPSRIFTWVPIVIIAFILVMPYLGYTMNPTT